MINAHIFIIPNSCGNVGSAMDVYNRRLETAGFDIRFTSPDEKVVQTWTTNEESDNWADHGPDERTGLSRWPSCFPARWFNGMKEGDKKYLLLQNGKELVLELNQLQHRYARFGRFEEAMAYAIA